VFFLIYAFNLPASFVLIFFVIELCLDPGSPLDILPLHRACLSMLIDHPLRTVLCFVFLHRFLKGLPLHLDHFYIYAFNWAL